MSLSPSISQRLRRNAERLRSVGWLNFSLTMGVWFFAPDRVEALVMACFWVVLVLVTTQLAAWRMDLRANQAEQIKALEPKPR